MGWYQGVGARRVWARSLLPGTAQSMPTMDPATGLVDCQWINPVSVTAENHQPGHPCIAGPVAAPQGLAVRRARRILVA